MRHLASVAVVAGCLVAVPAAAAQVTLTAFGGQTFPAPYHVASPPGDPNRVFVVEGAGTIRLVKGGMTQGQPFLSIPADVLDGSEGPTGCECGMFSMAFAPDYATSGLFYVFYTRDAPAPNQHFLVIKEFRRSAANPDLADPGSGRDVLVIPHFTAPNHNGGQLQFGPDGMLYISTGDGGNTPNQAQDKTTLLGKILRVDPRGSAPGQYSIPPGNPLADGPGGDADEIFVLGLRNPYRFSFDRSTGDLTIGDVGGGTREEIDFKVEGTAAGSNFGWPCFEGTATGSCSLPASQHSPPALEYPNGGMGAAVNGGFVIRDPALPSLAGRYLFADSFGAIDDLRTAQLSASGPTTSTSLGVGVPVPVSFGQDACGHLYVTDLAADEVFRIDPASGPSALCKLAPAVTLDAGPSAAAATTGALQAAVTCDEDCTATVRGSVTVSVGPNLTVINKDKGKRKKAKKKKRKGRKAVAVSITLDAQPVTTRVQLGGPTQAGLDLSAADHAALAISLKAGASATARLSVTATGGGGGSADASGSVALTKPTASQAKKKKKKKRKRKRKRR